MKSQPRSPSRRSVLLALGRGAGVVALAPWLSDDAAAAFAALQRSGDPAAPRVLTSAELGTLRTYVEAILPADERSPGAGEARVAEYIDLLLSESEDEAREKWRRGLGAVEAEAQARFGGSFASRTAEQVETLLLEWSRNEKAPRSPLEAFFKTTKAAAVQGYYSSEIGIHRELRYKGNSFTPEFVGCLADEGRDCPHCGRKAR